MASCATNRRGSTASTNHVLCFNFFQFHTTDMKYPGLPGLEDLGITPSSVEQRAIEMMRFHRKFRYQEADMDETMPAKTVDY